MCKCCLVNVFAVTFCESTKRFRAIQSYLCWLIHIRGEILSTTSHRMDPQPPFYSTQSLILNINYTIIMIYILLFIITIITIILICLQISILQYCSVTYTSSQSRAVVQQTSLKSLHHQRHRTSPITETETWWSRTTLHLWCNGAIQC